MRLAELASYEILDTDPEVEFDDFTALAAQVCQAPFALISLVEESRQWFKSCFGISATETPRDQSFCHYAVESGDFFEVPDATLDPRFMDNPLVIGEPYIRFYGGMPLICPKGYYLGTICVLDKVVRELTDEQKSALRRIARLVMLQIVNRKNCMALIESKQALREHVDRIGQVIDNSMDACVISDTQGRVKSWNPQAERIFGWTLDEVFNVRLEDLIIAPSSRDEHAELLQDFVDRNGERADGQRYELDALTKNGNVIPIELTVTRIVVNGEFHLNKFIRDLSKVKDDERKLKRTSDLLVAVGELQSRFIMKSGASRSETFEELLKLLLMFTGSEYGFVAEVLYDDQQNPYMKTQAITDISWNQETRALFQKHKAAGLEFRNLNTLFGAGLVSGKPVIANTPASDKRRGGLPPGHPPLNAFLGVPIWQGGEMIAMVGVSNREGGYDEALVKEIEPLLATYATIIRGFRVGLRQQADQERIEALNQRLEQRAAELAQALETNVRIEREKVEVLREHSALLEKRVSERTSELELSKKQFEDLFEFAPDALVITDKDGKIRLVNRATEDFFGWTREELLDRPVTKLIAKAQQGIYRDARARLDLSGEKASLRGLRKGAEEFPLELRISRLGSRESDWVVTAMRDVSERNMLENEMAKISSHEQERLAHELHDHLGAYLAGIAFRFKMLSEQLKQQNIQQAETASELVGQVNDAINQVRNFARMLAPVDLVTGGLSAGLRELGREINSVFGIEIAVIIGDNIPVIGHEQSMQLYRIAQESTRNAINHGRAKNVEISLDMLGDYMVLTVASDGQYWQPEMHRSEGMGIRIMRHRAESMGGVFFIEVSQDGKCCVSCRIPLSLVS